MEPEIPTPKIYENRNKIASIILFFSFVLISGFIITAGFDLVSKENIYYQKILDNVFPLVATWVGAVIAYYFGRENFESAAKQYESIIQKLTPEILDDVLVNQIMIDKATMVYMEDNQSLQNSDIKVLVDFMNQTKKSRLPILSGDRVKYIVHLSSFNQAIASNPTPATPITFSAFSKGNDTIKLFENVASSTKLEAVLVSLKNNDKVQDVFVEENGKVIGWLPDSLIKRYLLKN
jgi:hypothetical protein